MEKTIFCPRKRAIAKAKSPEIRNLTESNKNGGASNMDIRADVNALDQINAKVKPKNISRIFICLY